MANVIQCKPRGNNCDENLVDYVKAAKSLPFIRTSKIVWDANKWDLDGLAKPERAGSRPTVSFAGGRTKLHSLTGQMGEFSRAYVAFKIAEEFGVQRQVGKFTKPVSIMRMLAGVMADLGTSGPSDITPAVLDAVVENMRAAGRKEYGIEQRSKTLELVARELNDVGVVRSPFEWSPGTAVFKFRSRINNLNADRNLTSDEIAAVAEAFARAETPRQQMITSILALLCSVPARISELLELPVDCDVVLDPGDGYQAGLRWWPKKGGAPQVKFVPKAMVPVVQEALFRIKQHTEPARKLARAAMDGSSHLAEIPEGWPTRPGDYGLPYDHALMVAHPYTITGGHSPILNRIEPITYHQIRRALIGGESESVFEEMGIRLPDGAPVLLNSHGPRHYLNTIAAKASVPQADIALWSGRKNIAQNTAYDHETPQELLARIKKTRSLRNLPSIPIDNQSSFDVAQVKETAHTTQFGWCAQSLRQNPCEMFGKCLNCTHLICIKGAETKLANIKQELERERELRTKAEERIADGLNVSNRWMETFDKKISRLEQLIAVLENDDVVDGSPVRMADVAELPQFDPVAPGKSRASRLATQSVRKGDTDA